MEQNNESWHMLAGVGKEGWEFKIFFDVIARFCILFNMGTCLVGAFMYPRFYILYNFGEIPSGVYIHHWFGVCVRYDIQYVVNW